MRGMTRVLLGFAVFVAVLVPHPRLQAATTIQPGDEMISSVGGCTLGFAATGGTSTYFMTAAHCVERVGANIELGDGTVFGDVAVIGNADNTATDWALIKVRSAYVPVVRGTVRGLPGTPSGYTTAGETALGDTLRFSGYGIPWFLAAQTRENRYGVVVSDDAETYTAIGLDTNGDSGGPIIHEASGQAYGLVSRLCIGPCTSEGPTVQGIRAKAAAKGYSITLKTV
jgi:hypothetical protein